MIIFIIYNVVMSRPSNKII